MIVASPSTLMPAAARQVTALRMMDAAFRLELASVLLLRADAMSADKAVLPRAGEREMAMPLTTRTDAPLALAAPADAWPRLRRFGNPFAGNARRRPHRRNRQEANHG